MLLEELLVEHEVSANRRETLVKAIELGATMPTLRKIRDAIRVARGNTIILPMHHLETLSRGRGWARKGRGNDVTWGERVDGGYQVGPGNWTIGGNDGFTRKKEVKWSVENVKVGEETWTIAS